MDDQVSDNANPEEQSLDKKDSEENIPVKRIEPAPEKKRGREEKLRKGDERKLEYYLKDANVHSTEEKLGVMCKKYSALLEENKTLQATLKQYDRKMQTLQRQKEQFQNEQSKAILTRKRLESLCRELQKQNNDIKKENLLKIKQQEHMSQRNGQLFEEHLELKEKSMAVFEQIEQRQQEVMEFNQQMKLEIQLANAKIIKAKLEAAAEKEEFLREKQLLLCTIKEYQEQIKKHQGIEAGLRSQINIYTEKYDEFQNALSGSDKIYGEFNQEMQKMSKKILSLEKETAMWKKQWVKSHTGLLEMATEKRAKDAEIAKLNEKFTVIQNLCKVLQRERNNLLALQREAEKKNKDTKSDTPPAETVQQTSPQDEAVETSDNNLDNISSNSQGAPTEISEKIADINDEESEKIASVEQIEKAVLEEARQELNDDTENTENKQADSDESAKTVTEEVNPKVNNTDAVKSEQSTGDVPEENLSEAQTSERSLVEEATVTDTENTQITNSQESCVRNIPAEDGKEVTNILDNVTNTDANALNHTEHEEREINNELPKETSNSAVDNPTDSLEATNKNAEIEEHQNTPTIAEQEEANMPTRVDENRESPAKSESTDAKLNETTKEIKEVQSTSTVAEREEDNTPKTVDENRKQAAKPENADAKHNKTTKKEEEEISECESCRNC